MAAKVARPLGAAEWPGPLGPTSEHAAIVDT